MKSLKRSAVIIAGFNLLGRAAIAFEIPNESKPIFHPVYLQTVTANGLWFGIGAPTPLFDKPQPGGTWFSFALRVDADLKPSPELRLLEQTKLVKKPLPPSERLTFNPEANEVQLDTGDRIISYSLDELHPLPELQGITWSFVTPAPDSRDVLMLLARDMIVMFQVPRDDPEVWHRMALLLCYQQIDRKRVHAAGFGVYREGSQTIMLLPGIKEDRAWEIQFASATRNHHRVHLFPLPLPQ